MKPLLAATAALGLIAAVAFSTLDVATAAMVIFALVAAIFFGSLPWTIGAIMDRSRARPQGGIIVKGFDDPTPDS